MKRYKIGSSVLCLDNCKDADYVVLSNEYGNYKMIYDKETKEDVVYITEEYLNSILTFKHYNMSLIMFNYQYDREIIGKDFPIEYHLLDYRNELVNYLKEIVKFKMFNFNKRIKCNGGNCTRMIYHIAYNVFILQNNSPILTNEQKAIVQKIHDHLMPISYIDDLEQMINKLEETSVNGK